LPSLRLYYSEKKKKKKEKAAIANPSSLTSKQVALIPDPLQVIEYDEIAANKVRDQQHY
jgi:hypothetical protein